MRLLQRYYHSDPEAETVLVYSPAYKIWFVTDGFPHLVVSSAVCDNDFALQYASQPVHLHLDGDNSISLSSPHVSPMGHTFGELAKKRKEIPTRRNTTALFRA